MEKPYIVLKSTLKKYNMKQKELALRTSLSTKTISELLSGKTPISYSIAIKLEYAFNIPSEFWINLEKEYSLSIEKEKEIKALTNETVYLKEIPYDKLARLNIKMIPKTKVDTEKVYNLKKYFGISDLSLLNSMKLHLEKYTDKISYLQLAIMRKCELEATDKKILTISLQLLKKSITYLKKYTKTGFYINKKTISEVLKKCGIYITLDDSLKNPGIILYKNKKGYIILNANLQENYMWFYLFYSIHILTTENKVITIINKKNNCKRAIATIIIEMLIKNKDTKILKSMAYVTDKYVEILATDNDVSKSFLNTIIKESKLTIN